MRRGVCSITRRAVKVAKEVQHGAVQKPWLRDVLRQVYAHRLDNHLADQVSLGLGFPILRREARFQDDVDRSADVDLAYLSVEGHADVLLLSVEQHGERGGRSW